MALTAPPKRLKSTYPDDEHVALWGLYIRDGLSATQSALIMNERFANRVHNKNTVVAYADREGWVKSGHGGTVKPQVQRFEPKGRKARPVGPKSAQLVDLDPVVDSRLVNGQLVDVRERSCRFPVGVTRPFAMAEQLFCGKVAAPWGPYCRACARVAYLPEAVARMEANYARPDR
jgi:hypothetical protein